MVRLHGHSGRRGERNRGFTLAEALAAMLFLAIVLPAVVQAFLAANRTGVAAERRRIAVELAESKLNALTLTEDWRREASEGDFAPDFPGYHWTLSTDGWSVDALRVVTVEVHYVVQGAEQSVRLSTLAAEEAYP